MKRTPVYAVIALCCTLPMTIRAQPATPATASTAASAASAPFAASAASGPRLMTPKERRDNSAAAAAPDLRPDRPVVPQIRIPLGRTPTPASAPSKKASQIAP